MRGMCIFEADEGRSDSWAQSALDYAMSTADLTLDLFASPACGLDGPRRELAVLACILDHCRKPVLAVES